MNVRRGFLRLTVVVSTLVGAVFMFLYPKPSLESFRLRPATETERNEIKKWEASHPNPDYNNLAPEDSDKVLDRWLIEKTGGLLKEHQKFVPVQFVAQYYCLPLFLGIAASWILYAIVRIVFVGYIGRGFGG